MKRLKFLVNTNDKYTGTKYEENKEYEFEDERADELLKAKRKNGDKKGEPLAILIETVSQEVVDKEEESKEEKETTNNEEVELVSNEEENKKETTTATTTEGTEEEKKDNKNRTTKK